MQRRLEEYTRSLFVEVKDLLVGLQITIMRADLALVIVDNIFC